jgi:hypothetical protein
MSWSTPVAPLGARALLLVALTGAAGCVGEITSSGPQPEEDGAEAPDGMEDVPDPSSPVGSDDQGGGTGGGEEPEQDLPGDEPNEDPGEEASPCALGAPGVYTPFGGAGAYPSGPVSEMAWAGSEPPETGLAYPAGDEDFRGYGDDLPARVECSDEKWLRSHLDVTSGCLDAVQVGDYTRGLIDADGDDYFRALALGYTPDDPDHAVKWTDQGIEYRFLHNGETSDHSNPGFKAFLRYRSEDDLYVATWRFDGVVQILSKLCGEYTSLAVDTEYGPPSPDVFHTIRFEAVGDTLQLYLDDDLALTATSSTLSWGTAGIRIDSADGTYIDDWSVYQP